MTLPDSFLVTERQRAVLRVLQDAGVTEGGTDSKGQRVENAAPQGLALMLDMALEAGASATDLVGIMTWGQDELANEKIRMLATKIVDLRGGPPA